MVSPWRVRLQACCPRRTSSTPGLGLAMPKRSMVHGQAGNGSQLLLERCLCLGAPMLCTVHPFRARSLGGQLLRSPRCQVPALLRATLEGGTGPRRPRERLRRFLLTAKLSAAFCLPWMHALAGPRELEARPLRSISILHWRCRHGRGPCSSSRWRPGARGFQTLPHRRRPHRLRGTCSAATDATRHMRPSIVRISKATEKTTQMRGDSTLVLLLQSSKPENRHEAAQLQRCCRSTRCG